MFLDGSLLESGTKGGIGDWTMVRANLSSVSRTRLAVSIYSLSQAYGISLSVLMIYLQHVRTRVKREEDIDREQQS